ncbi:DUF323 domain-containing protein [Mycena belliarum]|uniref:DUF323 domain-containing protein n=1 Tax=Mycena belliarum TaxID=1033014 RepID=A0AAD6TYA6_9AGAR|nr:DUF323 domain-containing protein [Mycena belliae]
MPAQIIDLQKELGKKDLAFDMGAQVLRGLQSSENGGKHLPTMLLYDERGLRWVARSCTSSAVSTSGNSRVQRLYDDITTHVPEYYLFGAEEEILKNKADEIVAVMHQGTGGLFANEVVLELGAGALRKTSLILLALARLVGDHHTGPAPVMYYALDLEERELQRTLAEIAASDVGKSLKDKVDTRGLCATYDQGLQFAESGALHTQNAAGRLSRASFSPFDFSTRDASPNSGSSASDSSDAATSPPSTPDETVPPLHLLFLGSSLGNFARGDAADFLRSMPLRPGSGDTLLIGMDHDNEKAMIEEAYNDRRGYTKKFIMNGLKGAGKALGDETLFDEENWEYVNNYDITDRRHEAFYQSKRAHTVVVPSTKENISFLKDEKVKVEESFKYSETDAYTIFTEGGLRPVQRWTDSSARYSLWLLERPPFIFPLLASPRACNTKGELVLKKPYSSSPFGVPSPQDWENLWAAWDCITRRMIPPSMLMQKPIDLRHICLFYLGHIPTFLDIHLSRLLEEPHTEPEAFKYIFERGIDPDVDDPTKCHPHSKVPNSDEDWPSLMAILQFQARVRARLMKLYEDIDAGRRTMNRKAGRVLFMTFEHEALHAETLLYMLLQRAGSGTLPPPGFAPPAWASLAETWDAAPQPVSAAITLGPATITLGHDDNEAEDEVPGKDTDVMGHEFGWDNEHPKREVQVDEFRIEWRPVTNGQFFEYRVSQGADVVPLPASWAEINGEMHVRTLYGPIPLKIAQHWPVLTSYSALSKYAIVQGGRLPTEAELRLFLQKFESGYEGGANLGFRNWHPIPATTGGERGGGRGGNGGVWEWTSTVFDRYEGFEPSALYPGYSMDFFDGAHQVVLGGSYATIPRIAERKSVRNWYHHKYPFSWVSGRVVYDVKK